MIHLKIRNVYYEYVFSYPCIPTGGNHVLSGLLKTNMSMQKDGICVAQYSRPTSMIYWWRRKLDGLLIVFHKMI